MDYYLLLTRNNSKQKILINEINVISISVCHETNRICVTTKDEAHRGDGIMRIPSNMKNTIIKDWNLLITEGNNETIKP